MRLFQPFVGSLQELVSATDRVVGFALEQHALPPGVTTSASGILTESRVTKAARIRAELDPFGLCSLTEVRSSSPVWEVTLRARAVPDPTLGAGRIVWTVQVTGAPPPGLRRKRRSLNETQARLFITDAIRLALGKSL